MATKTIYTCDGNCGTEAPAVLNDRESDQWGVAGIPTGWLELALVRWGEVPADGANGGRREVIYEKAVFHSAECMTETIANRDIEPPPEG